MIKVESLIYKIDQKLNKVVALEHQVIPIENKILALNEAQLKLVTSKLSPNNILGLGLDALKKRYEDLEVLIEPASAHELNLSLVDKKINRWETSLDSLKPQYMFYIDSYILADKGKCKNKVVYVNRLVKHADVATLLVNTNYSPSFEYEETFCTISSSKLEIYTDGTFTPSKAYVTYIRYPKKIDFAGYIDLEGNASSTVDCELPEYLEAELLALTIEELAMDTENVPAIEFAQGRKKTVE